MSGAEFFFSKVDAKLDAKKTKKFQPDGIEVKPEEIDALLEDPVAAGKKLVAGIRRAVTQIEEIAQCGLTPEALVLLVAAKTKGDKNGNATSVATVQRVLEGLFRLGEHVR